METSTKEQTKSNGAATEQAAEKGSGKKKRIMIFAGIGTVALLFLVIKIISSMGIEDTDNAQLDATIVPVRSVVQGFVTEVRFADNSRVKKGDTLLMIDPTDYLARLEQAGAALESAKAQLEFARSGATAADANASASDLNSKAAKENIAAAQARLTRSEKEFTRSEKMLKDGAITQQQFDASRSEYETAKAQYEVAVKQSQAYLEQASGAQSQAQGQKSQINLAAAVVKQREAELALAQSQYKNTFVLAPFDGIISKKSVEKGQYLQIGSPVCSAVDIDHLYVSANFKETQIKKMAHGQAVEIKVDAFPGVSVSGKLESIGGATGAKFSLLPPDNATGNFVKITQRVPVRIAIETVPAELQGRLLPGLSAVVEVHVQ